MVCTLLVVLVCILLVSVHSGPNLCLWCLWLWSCLWLRSCLWLWSCLWLRSCLWLWGTFAFFWRSLCLEDTCVLEAWLFVDEVCIYKNWQHDH
ncbi:hypothetical protein BGX38DRAFT_1191640, partial [Terfezia claveryi]